MTATKTVGEIDGAGRIVRIFHRTGSGAWTHQPEEACTTCPAGMGEAIAAHNARTAVERRTKRDDPAAYMRDYRSRMKAQSEVPAPVGRPRKTELERKRAAAKRARRYRAQRQQPRHGLLPDSRHESA